MASSDSSAGSGLSGVSSAAPSRHEEAVDRFVRFWGTMASNWGINRTMARIYALLYCADRPLNTDDVMERLQISRGSANMNLRSLVEWQIAEKVDVPDSRKDHYRAETDVWTVTARIIEERERRELRPVKRQLREVATDLVPEEASLDEQPESVRVLHRRFQKLLNLMEVFEGVSDALLPLVKNRNEALIRKLISLTRSVQPNDSSPASSTGGDEP